MPSKGNIPRTCEQCGASFLVHPCRVKPGRGRFCSLRCARLGEGRIGTPPADRFWKHVDKTGGPDACWPWMGRLNKDGYGNFHTGSPRRAFRAHRYSYLLAYGSIPVGMEICHNCPGGDNPACVNPAHLWPGTNADNIADKVAKGRQARGERNGSARLTAAQVSEIRRLAHSGAISQREVARRYGIRPDTVWAIVKRRVWKHVP